MKICYRGQQVFLKSAESQRKNKTAKRRSKFSQGTRYLPLTKGVSMTGKYHYISALAEMTAADIVKNENEWTRFLTTAAKLYKYPFNEQMLIYAQMGSCS